MRIENPYRRKQKNKKKLRLLIILILLIFHANIFYFLFKDFKDPVIVLTPTTEGKTNLKTIFNANITDESGIEELVIKAYRNDESVILVDEKFETPPTDYNFEFQFSDIKLPDGEFNIEITAFDASFARLGLGNKETINYVFDMDTSAPKISVVSNPANIRRGGSAAIKYTTDADVVETGIRFEGHFFPAFKNEEGEYICFFPFPYFMTISNYVPEIMAIDDAGNETSSRLLINLNNRVFIDDVIKIDEAFLKKSEDKIIALSPIEEGTLFEKYQLINKQVRKENLALFEDITDETADEFLFTESFQRQPGAALRGGFGDTRIYMYNGEQFDYQFHTGLDYASVAKDIVRATNKGKVIFTGNVGIFGNVVIVDHGMSIHSLYAHLTDFHVQVGDEVEKNGDLGTTGTTGMVLGDHVHFSILVGGIPVNPTEWIDANWLKNNITSRIN